MAKFLKLFDGTRLEISGTNGNNKWNNSTKIPFITGVITHLLSGMSHQVGKHHWGAPLLQYQHGNCLRNRWGRDLPHLATSNVRHFLREAVEAVGIPALWMLEVQS